VKLLGVSVVDKVCYVNLSEEFADELVNVASEVEIYSIVNSLCSLDYIDSVKIFINGDYSKEFKDNISLDRLYKYNQSLVR
jgi:germination protein M